MAIHLIRYLVMMIPGCLHVVERKNQPHAALDFTDYAEKVDGDFWTISLNY